MAMVALGLTGQTPVSSLETRTASPKPGDRVAIHAQFGDGAPALNSADGYNKFIQAVKAQDKARVKALWNNGLTLLTDGCLVEVIGVEERGTDHGPSGQQFPVNVPVAVVKVIDRRSPSSDLLWVPVIYFRKPSDPAHPALSRFPVLSCVPDPEIIPSPGLEMLLVSPKNLKVPVTKNVFDFTAMVKAFRAEDDEGISELEKRKRMTWVDSFTRILVIERHTNPFLANGVHAVEARILDGPYKDQSCWATESYTAKLTLQITSFREAAAKRRQAAEIRQRYPQPKKSKRHIANAKALTNFYGE
jgi:hypothetical protein